MKRFTLHIISLSLAYLFLTVGCGANVTDYCCNLCEEHGSQMFTSNSCEEVHTHHHDNNSEDNACCNHQAASKKQSSETNFSENGQKCELHRLQIEEPIVQAELALAHVTFVTLIFTQEPLVSSTETTKPVDFICLKAPPKSGRDILSKISILTI